MKTICLLFAFCLTTFASANNPAAQQALRQADKQFFIENKGQWPDEVLYLTRMGGLDAWITKRGVTYDFHRLKVNSDNSDLSNRSTSGIFGNDGLARYGHVVRVLNVGAKPNATAKGVNREEGYHNYFIGNDPSKWASYVGLYSEAIVQNIFEGIDQRWYFYHGYLRYDFIIAPHADYRQIQLYIEGAYNHKLLDNKLVFTTRFGDVEQRDLLVYQIIEGKKVVIPASWKIYEDRVGFELSDYNPNFELVIDPVVWSTFIGGSGVDGGLCLAFDGSGNVFITGGSMSSNYPTTTGAYDLTFGGGVDGFVTKLNADGSSLIFSTFFGGSGEDWGTSLALDGFGDVYFTGVTMSANNPTTPGAFDMSFNGEDDAFVAKLNNAGSALIYATFLGGTSWDNGNSIVVNANGNAFVVGETQSVNYPVSSGAFDVSFNGFSDVFLTKLNPAGSALVFSTFLGGSEYDWGVSIDLNTNGNVYLTGGTESSNYPTTTGAFDLSYSGVEDVFVTKLNPAGNALIYSTFIGGSSWDEGIHLSVDGNGYVFITGTTSSVNFPTTSGAFDVSFNGLADVFVTRLNPAGNALTFSTFIGGSGWEDGFSLAINSIGSVFVTGITESANFPFTLGAFDTSFNGHDDVFVTKLSPAGNALIYSTLFGGSSYEEAYDIAINSIGDVFITGITESANFPISTGAFDRTFNGVSDVFVTKFRLGTVTHVPVQSLYQDWTFYPNPTDGNFTITTRKDLVFDLIDNTGRIISTYFVPTGSLNISEQLMPGFYFIRERESGTTKRLLIVGQ